MALYLPDAPRRIMAPNSASGLHLQKQYYILVTYVKDFDLEIMSGMHIIQLQSVTEKNITSVLQDVKEAIIKNCGGADDMHVMGNKALIVRAEIIPEKIDPLCSQLMQSGVKVISRNNEIINELISNTEYCLTLQVVSFSEDTDRKNIIPMVPG